jgi:uncharacterized protein (DUF2384 family)
MSVKQAVAILGRGADLEPIKHSANLLLIQQFQELCTKAPEYADLILAAEDAFGSESAAYGWLTRPHLLLENKSPLETIVGGHGNHVQRILAVINYGGSA